MEWILFLHRFIRAPRLIGSLAPSSQHLAQTIVNAILWDRCRTIVELGAGTGGITRAIQARMRPGSELHIFEIDPVFRGGLAREFPAALLHEDARELSESIGRSGSARPEAIISGLPFTLMSEDQRKAILREVCSTLAPEGVFVAFQYTPHLWSLFGGCG